MRSGWRNVGWVILCLVLNAAAPASAFQPAGTNLAGIAYFVDDDAPDDPGPNDPKISDPLEDGSAEHPFDSIQQAVDSVLNACDLRILPGTYRESVSLPGNCRIVGSGSATTILEAPSGSLRATIRLNDPAASAEFEIGQVTLRGLRLLLSAYPSDSVQELRLSIHDVVVQNGTLDIYASGDCCSRRVVTTIQNVEVQGGGISVFVAALYPGLDLVMRAVTLSDGDIFLGAGGAGFHADVDSLMAPRSTMDLVRSSGGAQSVSIRDSTLGGIVTQSNLGDPIQVLLNHVHFSGNGITTADASLNQSS